MKDIIKIFFFGDIVGRPGREAVADYILKNKLTEKYFIIANVENASHGFGLTEKNYNWFVDIGLNVMTSGNHIWDKKDIFTYIKKANLLLRPINYGKLIDGVGSKVFEKNGVKVGVINALGKVFMDSPFSAWNLIEKEIKKIKKVTPIVIIDFHAEATAEKIAFARYCSDFGASAVLGTHTHVQTADEQILNNKTAYITDAGFTGAADGVIGMTYTSSLNKLLTGINERFEVPTGTDVQINAVEIDIDIFSGTALKIKRINLLKKSKNEVEKI